LIFIQYYHIFRLFQPPSGRNSHSRLTLLPSLWCHRRFGHLVISFGATKPLAHSENGDGVPETSENFQILTRLSARENFIDSVAAKTSRYVFSCLYATANPVCTHLFLKWPEFPNQTLIPSEFSKLCAGAIQMNVDIE